MIHIDCLYLKLQPHTWCRHSSNTLHQVNFLTHLWSVSRLRLLFGGLWVSVMLVHHTQDAVWQSFNIAVCVRMCSQSLQKFSHVLSLQHAAVKWSWTTERKSDENMRERWNPSLIYAATTLYMALFNTAYGAIHVKNVELVMINLSTDV